MDGSHVGIDALDPPLVARKGLEFSTSYVLYSRYIGDNLPRSIETASLFNIMCMIPNFSPCLASFGKSTEIRKETLINFICMILK